MSEEKKSGFWPEWRKEMSKPAEGKTFPDVASPSKKMVNDIQKGIFRGAIDRAIDRAFEEGKKALQDKGKGGR